MSRPLDDQPHPMGLIDNPEWQVTLTRHAELYIAEHARREDPEREPSRMNAALAITAMIGVALALFSAVL